MPIIRSKLIERAENARTESKLLDFKREFDISSPAHWCDIVKHIVAFANSGRGVVVFGVNNDPPGVCLQTTQIGESAI
jgi:hypothetical protein